MVLQVPDIDRIYSAMETLYESAAIERIHLAAELADIADELGAGDAQVLNVKDRLNDFRERFLKFVEESSKMTIGRAIDEAI